MFCGIYCQIFVCKSCFVDCGCLQFNVTLDMLCQAAWLWHSDVRNQVMNQYFITTALEGLQHLPLSWTDYGPFL